MTNYQIEPFELTADFMNCWEAAGRHLNLRVKDTGASWSLTNQLTYKFLRGAEI